MADAYCGKDCQVCSRREELLCPGCKFGPGHPMCGDCDLAGCVRRKGLETCDTCSYRPNCSLMRSREEMPEKRQRKREQEQRRREAIAKKAPILGKGLWILFWLVVPNVIGVLMCIDIVAERFPWVYTAGVILQNAVTVAYSLILLWMGSQVDRYRTAGICGLIAFGISFIQAVTDSVGLNMLLRLPGIVMPLVYEYQEYAAHSDALLGVENTLANRWKVLWRWNLAGYCALVVGVFLVGFFLSLLGALLLLAAAVGMIVLAVLKMVFLFRSAELLRGYRYQFQREF